MEKIKVIWSDTGHWLARCNHQTRVIELNRRDFPRLSPMMQDYVFCHEYIHLLCNEYDENRCNEITDGVFVSRAKDERERIRRTEFLKKSAGSASHFDPLSLAAVITSGLGVIFNVGGSVASNIIAKNKKTGYYAMTTKERRELVTELMASAFAESANTNKASAKDIFWGYISQCETGDADYSAWARKNSFVQRIIKDNESSFGFGFEDTKTVNLMNYSGVKLAVVAAIIAAAVLIIKAAKK